MHPLSSSLTNQSLFYPAFATNVNNLTLNCIFLSLNLSYTFWCFSLTSSQFTLPALCCWQTPKSCKLVIYIYCKNSWGPCTEPNIASLFPVCNLEKDAFVPTLCLVYVNQLSIHDSTLLPICCVLLLYTNLSYGTLKVQIHHVYWICPNIALNGKKMQLVCQSLLSSSSFSEIFQFTVASCYSICFYHIFKSLESCFFTVLTPFIILSISMISFLNL